MNNKFFPFVVALAFLISGCNNSTQNTNTTKAPDTAELSEQVATVSTEVERMLAIPTKRIYDTIEDFSEGMTARNYEALDLGNRVMSIYTAIDYSCPDTVWNWAEATKIIVKEYAAKNNMPYDTAVSDLENALYGYEMGTQHMMNTLSYYNTAINTYIATAQYQRLINDLKDEKLRQLIRAEYNAWFEWLDAEYFTNVYHTHADDWYSALPLDLNAFHSSQIKNRLAVLDIERDILLSNKSYSQKGKTVTSKQWNDWLAKQGYRKGMKTDFNIEEPEKTDFPGLIKDKTERWISARQAVSKYLGTDSGKGRSYDNLTADIHACIVGKLKPLVKFYFGIGTEEY